MKIRNQKNGFTMVELIIVITILAVLAAVAIPITGQIISNANASSDESNVALFQSAIEKYVATRNTAAVSALPNGGSGVYPTTAGRAVQAIVVFTKVTAPIPAPKTPNYHFYYNTATHEVSYKAAAGTNDVLLDGVSPS